MRDLAAGAEVGMSEQERSAARLRVDWPRCAARGICHELAPELIDLDPWGYPIVAEALAPGQRDLAKTAARGCPRRALRLIGD